MKIERKTAGSVTILACAGAIDVDSVGALSENTDAVVGMGCRRLVVSLGDLEFASSAMLASLIMAHRRLSEVDGEVVISAASVFLAKTIKTLGLDQALKIFPDDRAALAHFGAEGGDFTASGARLKPPRPSGSEGAWPEEHPRPRP
ncbi:MAG: STAS domain-containing protein [Planctomycetota bacterium]